MEDREQLDRLTEELLSSWSREVVSMLNAQLNKRKMYLSGRLYQSLKEDVFTDAGASTQMMLLSFLDEGRIKDMRNVVYQKMPDIADIEDFVERVMYDGARVGKKPFTYVPGYKHGQFPLNPSKAINRIAWGVAISMRNANRIAPKPWFNKPFYGMINKLIDQLITQYAETSRQELKRGLTKLY